MFLNPRNPIEKEIFELEKSMLEVQKKVLQLRSELPEEEVSDYSLLDLEGNKVSLRELFGEHDELLLVHNMGPECSYCTLWADGFRKMRTYFESRCAFVLETDIPPEKLKAFKKERDWDFLVVSSFESPLKKEMGFQGESGNYPGVSSFYKKDEKIFRHAMAPFGPGDQFCHTWHFFNLLKKGTNDWQPQFNK